MARERKFSQTELFQSTKQLVLEHGYEGFTFRHLAERLNVSRSAIYKYYGNKEELITELMIYEMEQFLLQLDGIQNLSDFASQFDHLMNLILDNSEMHQLIEIGWRIPIPRRGKVFENKKRLEQLHLDLYSRLQHFVQAGKAGRYLKAELPDALILGYIFQSIAIPNHFGIPRQVWIRSMKEIIRHGIFENR
jgi:AcrR family transcriptional regulator